MLKVLKGKDEIRNAQETLDDVLNPETIQKIPVTIGYKGKEGKNEQVNVSYSKKHDMWSYLGHILKGAGGRERYWNAFGISRPKKNSIVPIVVEINPPVEGIYRRVSGVFAKDDKGEIFLLHRGKIGGGRKGIGLELFYKYYDGEKREVEDGKKVSDRPIALIGCITSPDFPEKLKEFIGKVDEIKNR